MKILAVNTGSSSLRARLLEFESSSDDLPAELWRAHLKWSTPNEKGLVAISSPAVTEQREISGGCFETNLQEILREMWSGPARVMDSGSEIRAVGHRVVHGGVEFGDITSITDDVKAEMARFAGFAPLHNTVAAREIAVAEQVIPSANHFAVFDTGFHRSLPDAARTYPGPYEWLEHGIRRYGFHGINHRYVARRASELLGRPLEELRLISCHLGNGASLTAVARGLSIDTTMGFTPLDGLMMGTRSGSIDPGIVTYLLRSGQCTAEELDRLLNENSGLKGLSGISGDMQEVLLAMSKGNARARLAFDVYAHRLCREIGAMLASLGGVDVLVFTGGIGENCPLLREIVCRRFEFIGLDLDVEKNSQSPADAEVSSHKSLVRTLVIRANEETEIAQACHNYILAKSPL